MCSVVSLAVQRLKGCGCISPLLQLWRWDEACCAIFCVLQLALPPVVVILGDNLDDVTHPKANAGLLAGDELIFGGVIFKLSPYVDLWQNIKCREVTERTWAVTLEEATCVLKDVFGRDKELFVLHLTARAEALCGLITVFWFPEWRLSPSETLLQ